MLITVLFCAWQIKILNQIFEQTAYICAICDTIFTYWYPTTIWYFSSRLSVTISIIYLLQVLNDLKQKWKTQDMFAFLVNFILCSFFHTTSSISFIDCSGKNIKKNIIFIHFFLQGQFKKRFVLQDIYK